MPTSRATALSLERLSPHRKASYKALMGEHYIGELEPFRAFCTLCHRWVDLSSRTPYSYGVWKGHVRKTDKHNRLRIGNTEDGYDTTSDRSQEDSGAPAAPETARDNRRSVVKTPATKGYNEILKVSSAPPSKVEPTIHSTRNQNNNTCSPGSSAVKNDPVQARNVALTPDIQSPIAPKLPAEANSLSAISKPVLTTTIEDRMSVNPSPRDIKQQSRRESPVHDAVEFRRRKLLQDPDVLDPDPRSVVCRRCQSRVELEGPDAYMIEKWLAHKDKCLDQTTQAGGARDAARQHTNRAIKTHTTEIHRNAVPRAIRPPPKGKGKAAGYRRAPSPITLPPLPLRPSWPGEDERKQQFIDDPDVQRIEPHRVLCKHCNCWIKLHPIIRYSQSVWPLHKTSCKDIQLVFPGDAKIRAKSEKEESRKQLLDGDAYATDVSPHRVTCKACGTNIRLDTRYKYEGSHWRGHRARCPRIPVQDRISKKRRISERRVRDNLPLENPSQAQVAVTDSRDSDDSAPRPLPTSFFTAPLEINISHMFKRRSRVIRPPRASVIAAAKAQAEADIVAHLQANQLASAMQDIIATSRADDNTIQPEETVKVLSTRRSPPAPDPETWIPRKRTREEEMEFDYFFNKIPPSPTPPNELRLCDLGKQAMQVVD
ncbi:hypothetical protein JB92DRAFT_3003658 [Gautieria morchelliformis]|nr:hypothetical protein JB92DRAFT_3003658 [Gautieria morchelliformis]